MCIQMVSLFHIILYDNKVLTEIACLCFSYRYPGGVPHRSVGSEYGVIVLKQG